MNFSFFHPSLFMSKQDSLSFNQWRQDLHNQQQKQDRLLWGSSLIGSSIILIGLIWVGFHTPHKPIPTIVIDAPPAITLDLSTDIAPASPPPMATQPNVQPLEEVTPPLDAPTVPSSDIVVPKTQKIAKIKPTNPKKNIEKHHILPQKPSSNTQQSPNTQPTIQSTNSSNINSSSVASSSHASSTTQKSVSPATWQSSVLRKLERFKQYPTEAQNNNQEGTVTIKITINREGHVLFAKLIKSSGYSLLDKEAIALSYRADPLPAVPQSIKGNKITITVPVEFDINR